MQRDQYANLLPAPGLRWGDYPELPESTEPPRRHGPAESRAEGARRLARVRTFARTWYALPESALMAQRLLLKLDIARQGLGNDQIEACCALAVEAARRTLGLAAHDAQIIAALHMLDNRLVEMAAGEGKSLAVALAAAMAGVAGIPVHVLVANDHLVARGAKAFRPLYAMLALSVAGVFKDQVPEARRQAYGRDIVYATTRELALDYLRDRQMHGDDAPVHEPPRRRLRGLCMAIVDDAESILIDEAHAPLILARDAFDMAGRAFLWQAWAVSGWLEAGVDFCFFGIEREVMLLDAGRDHVSRLTCKLQPSWKNLRHRDDLITTALTARHLLQRDQDYFIIGEPASEARSDGARIRVPEVREGDIRARDIRAGDIGAGGIGSGAARTDLLAYGRRWSSGLLALVGIKEGCKPELQGEALARITVQRLFSRYHRLGGTGSALQDARGELARQYGLTTRTVATRRPDQCTEAPTRAFATDAARWRAVVERCAAWAAQGRPVLIGTDSAADSAALSAWLADVGLHHALLSEASDPEEAAIVAEAGKAGRITIVTQGVGHGTPIHPDADSLIAGGLVVINCQLNPSHRLDRRLLGRAGRDGQPGHVQTWFSLEAKQLAASAGTRLFATLLRAFALRRVAGIALPDGEVHLPGSLLRAGMRLLQRADERRHARERGRLLRHD